MNPVCARTGLREDMISVDPLRLFRCQWSFHPGPIGKASVHSTHGSPKCMATRWVRAPRGSPIFVHVLSNDHHSKRVPKKLWPWLKVSSRDTFLARCSPIVRATIKKNGEYIFLAKRSPSRCGDRNILAPNSGIEFPVLLIHEKKGRTCSVRET